MFSSELYPSLFMLSSSSVYVFVYSKDVELGRLVLTAPEGHTAEGLFEESRACTKPLCVSSPQRRGYIGRRLWRKRLCFF